MCFQNFNSNTVNILEADPPPSVVSKVTTRSVSPLTRTTHTLKASPSVTKYSAAPKLSVNPVGNITQRFNLGTLRVTPKTDRFNV